MFKDLIELLGYEAVFCSSANECMKTYLGHAQDFDILILDYGERELMPRMIMEIFKKANPALQILLTSSKQVEEVSMIADLHDCSFIEKPFRMKDFSGILKNSAQTVS